LTEEIYAHLLRSSAIHGELEWFRYAQNRLPAEWSVETCCSLIEGYSYFGDGKALDKLVALIRKQHNQFNVVMLSRLVEANVRLKRYAIAKKHLEEVVATLQEEIKGGEISRLVRVLRPCLTPHGLAVCKYAIHKIQEIQRVQDIIDIFKAILECFDPQLLFQKGESTNR